MNGLARILPASFPLFGWVGSANGFIEKPIADAELLPVVLALVCVVLKQFDVLRPAHAVHVPAAEVRHVLDGAGATAHTGAPAV